MADLKQQLSHLLSSEQVDRYHQSFATLVFYELEIEKSNSFKESLPKVQQSKDLAYDPSGMINAINCFKDVKATACFGKMTIGKRYWAKEWKDDNSQTLIHNIWNTNL